MSSDGLSAKLTALLAEELDQAIAMALGARLAGSGHGLAVLELLTELREGSHKVAVAAIRALPDVLAVLAEQELVAWIDVAVSLSQRSGAAALKFCRESAELLTRLAAPTRGPALAMALDLAEQDANVTLEGLRQAAGVVAAVRLDALPVWAQVGADLAKWDYVVGVEYLRQGPEILKVLSVDDLKTWAAVGGKLVAPNNLGNPDYLAAVTFFRTSPLLLGALATPAVRRRVLAIGGLLADRSPAKAIEFLGEAPGWLRRIQDVGWQERVLQYAALVAEQDAAAALAYVRRAPDVLELAGEEREERFEEWSRGGMEALSYNPEAARAYFAVETRKALEAIERASSGVTLRSVARQLKLFAEGLSGHWVRVRALDDPGDEEGPLQGWAHFEKGTISLPARMGRYRSRDENLRVYKVLTAHEAGHLEYGTYDLNLSRLEDLAEQACLRYGRQPASPPASLEELFRLYPHPSLLRDLWVLAEDARIEACLKADYPGLRRDMEAVVREEVTRRSLLHGLSVREMIVEFLLRLSAGGPEHVHVPDALEEIVSRAWAIIQTVAQPHATAEAVVRAVHRIYVLIEELTAGETLPSSEEASPEADQTLNPHAGEGQGGIYRPVTNFAHRGAMHTERVRGPGTQALQERDEGPGHPGLRAGRESDPLAAPAGSGSGSTALILPALPGAQAFFYDEWDGTIQDYRTRWCRVMEQMPSEGSEALIERMRSTYGGVINLIRRYFEGIRPPAFRRVRRQADGDEVDLDAAVERLVERRATGCPSEFVYIRRDRRDRDVAAAFLVDLSGSTGEHIGPSGARIIDVEKEGVVLLCEALEAIGDQYAVYGYSGQSRREVQVLLVKDFDERYGPQVWRRLDALQPMVQNRDGAAIRHALHRLSARAARVKLLVVLSDGRPLDDAYQDEYALEDTKAALREAKAQGVHPFCITVDAEAQGYLARMYGDVYYLIIDRVESLPERLPRIYRMLTT